MDYRANASWATVFSLHTATVNHSKYLHVIIQRTCDIHNATLLQYAITHHCGLYINHQPEPPLIYLEMSDEIFLLWITPQGNIFPYNYWVNTSKNGKAMDQRNREYAEQPIPRIKVDSEPVKLQNVLNNQKQANTLIYMCCDYTTIIKKTWITNE